MPLHDGWAQPQIAAAEIGTIEAPRYMFRLSRVCALPKCNWGSQQSLALEFKSLLRSAQQEPNWRPCALNDTRLHCVNTARQSLMASGAAVEPKTKEEALEACTEQHSEPHACVDRLRKPADCCHRRRPAACPLPATLPPPAATS